jgi:hypothetical protein
MFSKKFLATAVAFIVCLALAVQQAVKAERSLEDWANIFQIFEAIVVAGSVLLILYQVWQQTKLTKVNSSHTIFQLYASFYTELIKNKDMATLATEGHKTYAESDKVDQFRYRATLAWRITLQATIYEQYHNGLLAKEIFKGWESDFRHFIDKRRVMDRWKDLKGFYNPAFHPYVERIIREVEDRIANPSSQDDKESDVSHVLPPPPKK